MTYYSVNGYTFSHYGEAFTFARKIGATVQVKKTLNPFKWLYSKI